MWSWMRLIGAGALAWILAQTLAKTVMGGVPVFQLVAAFSTAIFIGLSWGLWELFHRRALHVQFRLLFEQVDYVAYSVRVGGAAVFDAREISDITFDPSASGGTTTLVVHGMRASFRGWNPHAQAIVDKIRTTPFPGNATTANVSHNLTADEQADLRALLHRSMPPATDEHATAT